MDNNIKIKFCDSYDVAVKTEKDSQNKEKLANSHEGKCNNPNNLESIAYKEIIGSSGVHITFWERISNIWAAKATSCRWAVSMPIRSARGSFRRIN